MVQLYLLERADRRTYMVDWKNIKINGVVKIERLVDEFEVWELNKIPYGKFKVKVFETTEGKFTGRTNLMVIDQKECFSAGIGFGTTVNEALKDTIEYFYSLIDEVDNLTEECFEYVDAMDF